VNIIQQRKVHETVSFALFFERLAPPGSGFFFPCSEGGVVDESQLQPAGRESLAHVRADAHLFKVPVVERRVNRWVEPRVGLCSCGTRVGLAGFTNTCSGCGRDYNSAGQRLAPREQWGEETGETADEILRVDVMSDREIWGDE